jgi:hypothetical protein
MTDTSKPNGNRESSLLPMGSLPHLHNPCDRCGYPRSYKQFPLVCKCTTPDRCPHPPACVNGTVCRRCGGQLADNGLDPRQTDQVGRSAERGWIGEPQPPREWHTPGWVKTGGRHLPPLRVAERYAAGRPHG